jgi:hypothetical protein
MLASGVVDQLFITIEFTPQRVKRATYCIGCSSAVKCLLVITLRSTRDFKEFIRSKITIALHLLKIARSVISADGNLCSKQVIEK